MTLPAAQQRALDAIATELRWREPRLASLFATFTRLTSGDGPPRAETLPARRWLRARCSREPRATSESRAAGGGAVRAILLIPLAIALLVSATLVGLSTSHMTCPARYGFRGPATAHIARSCPPALQARYPGQLAKAAAIR